MNGMKDSSKTILNMEKDLKYTQMVTNIEECGQKVFLTVMEYLHGQMEESIKECFEMERRKDKVLQSNQMELDMKVIFSTIIITEMVNLKSKGSLSIKELFVKDSLKAKVDSYLITVKYMLASSETERKRGKEF